MQRLARLLLWYKLTQLHDLVRLTRSQELNFMAAFNSTIDDTHIGFDLTYVPEKREFTLRF